METFQDALGGKCFSPAAFNFLASLINGNLGVYTQHLKNEVLYF